MPCNDGTSVSVVAKRGSSSGGREEATGIAEAADEGTGKGASKTRRVPSCLWLFAAGDNGRENVRPFVVTARR